MKFWRRRDRGATTLEFIAVIVFVAGIITVASFSDLGRQIGQAYQSAVCTILQQEGCEVDAGGPSDPAPEGTCEAFCPTEENPMVPTDPTVAATKGNYAALGDSYSSGEGAEDYEDNTKTDANRCHRSGNAYSQLVGDEYNFRKGESFSACSGAKVDNLLHGQYNEPGQIDDNPNLNEETTLVTLSIGGNDLGFADVLKKCATDLHIHWPWDNPTSQCQAQRGNIEQKMKELFGPPNPSKYDKLLDRIHEKAPNARIMVVGYPPLWPDPPKHNYLNFRKGDQRFLNEMGRDLNANIRRAIERADQKYYGNGQQEMGSFEFIDPTDAFKGHEASNRPWEDNWIHPIWVTCRNQSDKCVDPGSFHPNKKGQQALADLVNRQIAEGPGRTLWDP